MIRQAWIWEFSDPKGVGLTEPISPAFSNQYEAERWLGGNWRAFAQSDVGSAKLMFQGAQVTPTLDLQETLVESERASGS